MDTETWAKALDSYRYPVDLRQFAAAGKYPDWFDCSTEPGDRRRTMAFEARFRKHGQHHLEAWGEVVFWKLYTMPMVTAKVTRKVLDLSVSPGELWSACMNYIERASKWTARMDYVDEESRKSFRNFRCKLFKTPVVATAATFPAFICPERFPMVDTQITKWAYKNGHCHRYSGIGGPDLEQVPELKAGEVLGERHWPFIQSWITWCRFTANKLTRCTGRAWRARDVEMAVFTAQRDNLPLVPVVRLEC